MLLSRISRSLLRRFRALLPMRALLRLEYEHHFAGLQRGRLFRGVFKSFDEAAASAPKTRGIGYQQPAAARMYANDFHWIFPSDYPVIFWLSRALEESLVVADFGGNVGISFYSFEKYLRYPCGVKWIVCDVPAVVEEGKKLAGAQGRDALVFTDRFADCDGADVFLASGVLQYLDMPIHQKLRTLSKLPRHLIINRVPLREGEPFVTLQAMGTAFCPYQIFNAAEFIGGLTDLGYELVDRWEAPDFPCEIPFYEKESLRAMSGLYLRRVRE
ncbi:MAG: hypothetical protein QOD99_1474 [Chthoniobacter sp.]|nr:hypothetical protein [Chthoniobacter sp.]